jgi:16S rRNA C1402 (ribose-2'-O) methylase RsmI
MATQSLRGASSLLTAPLSLFLEANRFVFPGFLMGLLLHLNFSTNTLCAI